MHLKEHYDSKYTKNNNHIGRTFDRYVFKNATLILLSKVGLGRTFNRSRFWRVFYMTDWYFQKKY